METIIANYPVLLLALSALICKGLWLYLLLDCVRNETSADNLRLLWFFGIWIFGFIGAAVYYFNRYAPRHAATAGAA